MSRSPRKADDLDPILQMSLRLKEDAQLLLSHDRFSSAFALAVLALEEQGKMIIRLWSEKAPLPKPKRRMNAHRRKQGAAASLLMMRVIFEKFELIPRNGLSLPPDAEATDEQVLKAIAESEDRAAVQNTQDGVLDELKKIALYQDDQPLIPDVSHKSFGRKEVKDVLSIMDKVELLMDNEIAMRAGRAVFVAWQNADHRQDT